MKPDQSHFITHAARLLWIAVAILPAPAVWGKLPPPTEEAKAHAVESVAKSAWADKVGMFQLCAATHRIAGAYRQRASAEGKVLAPAMTTPECVHPGDYVSPITPANSKPLESAGAHSPPGAAISPPSTKILSADIDKGVKK